MLGTNYPPCPHLSLCYCTVQHMYVTDFEFTLSLSPRSQHSHKLEEQAKKSKSTVEGTEEETHLKIRVLSSVKMRVLTLARENAGPFLCP